MHGPRGVSFEQRIQIIELVGCPNVAVFVHSVFEGIPERLPFRNAASEFRQ